MSSFRLTCLALAGALALSACQVPELPRLQEADLAPRIYPQTTVVYDRRGRAITRFHAGKNRIVVPLEKIPMRLRRAVIAVEDRRFYRHAGIDLRGIVRAAVTNARSGGVVQGGSTITQQYVKKRIIAPGRAARDTLERKIHEAALARQLEKRLTKDEILERYLNTVYFGNGAYGVETAAKTYFRKPARKLSLAQAALLAGLIRSPEFYDPLDHPKRARRRRNVVLQAMAETGFLPRARAERIAKRKLRVAPAKNDDRYPAPYFVDYVRRLITFHPRFSSLGKTWLDREERLLQGGLRIYTTLDRRMQRAAEKAIRGVLHEKSDPRGALVALDPKTGGVRAMVGGRDFFVPRRKDRFAQLNLGIAGRARLGRPTDNGRPRAPGTGRQAGSAFKPFVLAAALRRGIPLEQRFPAPRCARFPKVNDGKPWKVCNYGRAGYGRASLMSATSKSINTVYARLVLEVGARNVVKLARRMGIKTPLAPVPSAALGSNSVSPLGMAAAYGTFARLGKHHAPIGVRKIVDSGTGKTIYRSKVSSKRVLDKGTSFLVTKALQQVIRQGTGTAAAIGRPAAGKTGTAQEYRDAWFAGYTPRLSAAVWTGYPKGAISMKQSCAAGDSGCKATRITVTGGSWPAQIWARFMGAALRGKKVRSFRRPRQALKTVRFVPSAGCIPTASRQPRTVAVVPVRANVRRCAPGEVVSDPPEKNKRRGKRKRDREETPTDGGSGSDGRSEGSGGNEPSESPSPAPRRSKTPPPQDPTPRPKPSRTKSPRPKPSPSKPPRPLPSSQPSPEPSPQPSPEESPEPSPTGSSDNRRPAQSGATGMIASAIILSLWRLVGRKRLA